MRWVWDRGYPVTNADGSVHRYIGVAQDVTRRRASELALRRQERRWTPLMVHAFVRQSGGAMQVQSSEGHGSTVRLILPAVEAVARGQGLLPIDFPNVRRTGFAHESPRPG